MRNYLRDLSVEIVGSIIGGAIWVLVEVCSVSQDAQGNPFS